MKLNGAATVKAGFVAMVVAITGCAQPPTEQFEVAARAVEAAKAAGAPEYDGEDFAKLEQQFALVKDELKKQEEVLSIFRSYTDAERQLKQVVTTGQQVEVVAAQKKESAKAAAIAMEKEAQAVMDSAKKLMVNAPTGKERAAVQVIQQDLEGLEKSLSAMHQLIENGDYLAAEIEGKAIKEKGSAVSGEIQSAIDKTKGKKPRAHA